jgi:hypothetical protein
MWIKFRRARQGMKKSVCKTKRVDKRDGDRDGTRRGRRFHYRKDGDINV